MRDDLPPLKAAVLRTLAKLAPPSSSVGGEAKRILLSLADPQFDLLLTLDKNLSYQQNLDTKRTAVLIVRARSNRIQDLLPVIPECLAALERIQWQPVVRVDSFPPQ